ncbi:MAG: hypothetical protein AAF843_20180 [Bacteroidota bacterium]
MQERLKNLEIYLSIMGLSIEGLDRIFDDYKWENTKDAQLYYRIEYAKKQFEEELAKISDHINSYKS